MVYRRPAPQGGPLLRPVLARLGHPRDSGPADPRVPRRTCSAGVFKRHSQIDRPCLLGYIDKCSAPCIGRVSAEEHRRIVVDFCDFLSKTDRFARDLERQMNAAAEELDFERAARLRDDLGARFGVPLEKQAVVLGDGTDADVVAFADDDLGRPSRCSMSGQRPGAQGQRGWVVEKPGDPGDSAEAALVNSSSPSSTATRPGGRRGRRIHQPRAREVLVPCLPPNADELTTWLSGLGARAWRCVSRSAATKGARRDRTPQRPGGPAAAQAQAGRGLHREIGCAAEHPGVTRAGRRALRIECIDISHVQGHRRRRLTGGVRGRPAAQVGLPALRHPGSRR